jgi:threonyl-tRNA synthetase
LPRGAVIAEELEKLAKETEFAAGYQRVRTPHIARESLYLKSGHLPYYAESMFPPMVLLEEGDRRKVENLATAKAKYLQNFDDATVRVWNRFFEHLKNPKMSREDLFEELGLTNAVQDEDRAQIARIDELSRSLGDRYYLKAMNCPHHHKLFAALPRSYRDLPLRLAEYGTDYRYEKSGELFGLMRVRSLQMNDAHLYMTPEQFEAEFNAVNEMYLNYFKLFGIDKYLMRFSTHDPTKLARNL